MIVTREKMLKIEQNSGYDTLTLMERAGRVLTDALSALISEESNVLILCGKGNNGGDGLVIARLFKNRKIRIFLVEGEVRTPDAKHNHALLDPSLFIKEEDFQDALNSCDAVIDCVYGFSYHGALREPVRTYFKAVNASGKPVYSADINSGCECDTGNADPDALRSEITFALECFKPFHMLRKDHGMFRECRVLSMELPHPDQTLYQEMNEELFFSSFRRKNESSYKNSFGQLLLAGGSYGMAGALGLNILGAKTVGASYIHVLLPDSIYPVLASRFLTPVYHPVKTDSAEELKRLVKAVKACAFGSGSVSFPCREECLKILLEQKDCPVVIDAEGLRMIAADPSLLSNVQTDVILTPHIGEFSALCGRSIKDINKDKVRIVASYARDNHVIVVLKGPHTVVCSPDGDVYINQSGCESLAQAGSGDLLAGMTAALLLHADTAYQAACMAVWLHGYLSEPAQHHHSMQNFPLEDYPFIADQLFRKNGL